MTDRFDDLLEEALRSGDIPADASEAERIELRSLLGAAGSLQRSRIESDAEARAAMPVARARFERFVAGSQTPVRTQPVVAAAPRRRLVARLGFGPARLALSAAAAVALVVVLALAANAVLFEGATDAVALEPGDYVQVEGIVTSTTNADGVQQLQIESALGVVPVDVESGTSVIGADSGTLAPGARVLIGGVVRENRRLLAQTLSVAAGSASLPPLVGTASIRDVAELRPGVTATVLSLALAENGSGRVVVLAENDRRYVVPVDADSVQRLLGLGTAVGARVRITHPDALPARTFALEILPQMGGGQVVQGFERVTGVLTARTGLRMTIRTETGQVVVVIRPATRIVVQGTALSRDEFTRTDRAIGHLITVSGGRETATGGIVADVIIIGPEVPADAATPASGNGPRR